MKKFFALLLCLAMACTMLAGCGGTETTATLRIYNWGDYIDDDVLDQFRKDHPEIKVVYDMFDSNEAMLAKLEGGAPEYDVAVCCSIVPLLQHPNRLDWHCSFASLSVNSTQG